MNRTEINDNDLSLVIPEGFSIFTEEDFKAAGKRKGPNDWAIKNEECHLIFETSWVKIPFFVKGASVEKLAANAEGQVAKRVPGYQKGPDISRTIGGEKAYGFTYAYAVKDIHMLADYIVVKHGKLHYSVSWLSRVENYKEMHSILDTILDSVQFN